MEATILTLPFDEKRHGFPTEEIEDFCLNKQVHEIASHFFIQDGHPYWTVFIRFERVVAYADGVKDLSPKERTLYQELAKWRKATADKQKQPAFIVATNRHLVAMIKRKVRSKSGFDGIKGFGRKRIARYGEEIINTRKGISVKKRIELFWTTTLPISVI